MKYWIGQGFGLLATVTDIIMPLFPKKWQMLVANFFVNAFLMLNLVFLEEIGSGIFLFVVAMVQAAINLLHTLRNTQNSKLETVVFLVLYVGLGFYGLFTGPNYVPGLNWNNLLELLPIIGAVFSMSFIFCRDVRKARVLLVCTTVVWTVYHSLIGSTAFLGSFFGVVTGVIAIIKHRKQPEAKA